MEITRSVGDHLDQHGSSSVDVSTSKSKRGSHTSLASTNSASSLNTSGQLGQQKRHPLLTSRCSSSDSKLTGSVDNLKNSKRTSRSKNQLRLNLSLDSHRHGRNDPNSTVESTEDEDRTSADEYSTEDDGDTSSKVSGESGSRDGELQKSVDRSSAFFVNKAVEELVTTERTYVNDLHDVIQVQFLAVAFVIDLLLLLNISRTCVYQGRAY